MTQGNNSVSCTQGSPNCAKDTAGYYFETGYNATPGTIWLPGWEASTQRN